MRNGRMSDEVTSATMTRPFLEYAKIREADERTTHQPYYSDLRWNRRSASGAAIAVGYRLLFWSRSWMHRHREDHPGRFRVGLNDAGRVIMMKNLPPRPFR